MEDFYIGDASVRIFLPVFKMNFPEMVDMTLPAEGVFHNLVFVSIRKQYPYQAFKVMHGLWGMGQMMFSKYIVVVDEDCDVHNTSEVLFRLCANTDPERDTTIIRNPSDSLDHAPTEQNIGSHMGFDATRKLPGENYHRQWPEILKMTDEAKKLVDELQSRSRGACRKQEHRFRVPTNSSFGLGDRAIRRTIRALSLPGDDSECLGFRDWRYFVAHGRRNSRPGIHIPRQPAMRHTTQIVDAAGVRAMIKSGSSRVTRIRITARRRRTVTRRPVFLNGHDQSMRRQQRPRPRQSARRARGPSPQLPE